MNSLKTFLYTIQTSIRTNESSHFKLVLGNVSADLDSIVCSLCFAYLLSKTRPESDSLFIPVINIPQSQFKLRFDSIDILSTYLDINISELETYLVFIDHPFISSLWTSPIPARLPDISLVDHHECVSIYDIPSWIQDAVVRIVDHHGNNGLPDITTTLYQDDIVPDNIQQWDFKSSLKWITSPKVGSCASLITLLWKQANEKKLIKLVENDIRQLLSAAIIKDTIGLDPLLENKRWNNLDKIALCWVNQTQDTTDLLIHSPTFLKKLNNLRSNVNRYLDMGCTNTLLVDMKLYTYDPNIIVTYSSFSVSIDHLFYGFVQKGIHLINELNRFCKKYKTTMLILMSTILISDQTDVIKRELGIFFPSIISETLEREYLNRILQISNLELQLYENPQLPLFNAQGSRLYLYHQKNIHYSRKVLEPIIRKQFKDCTTS